MQEVLHLRRNPSINMDITYITPNIIAMSFPSDGLRSLFMNNITNVARYLDRKHGEHYLVFNLCDEAAYSPTNFHGRVVRIPVGDNEAPPLTSIQTFCQRVDQWLSSNPQNVIVVHCHAGRGRTGTMISCYLLYQHFFNDPEDAITFFASKRVTNSDSETPLNQSQRRYVRYFHSLITHTFRNRSLTMVTLCAFELETTIPNLLSSINPVFFTVDCRDSNSVFTSGTNWSTARPSSRFRQHMEVKEHVRLDGDVKVRVYTKTFFGKRQIFSFWFNTRFVVGPWSSSSPGGAACRLKQPAGLVRVHDGLTATGRHGGDSYQYPWALSHRQTAGVDGHPAGPYRTLVLSGQELDNPPRTFEYQHSPIFTDNFKVIVHFTADTGSLRPQSWHY